MDVEKNLISVFRNGSIFDVPIKILMEILQEEVYVTKLVVESAIGMLGLKYEQVLFCLNYKSIESCFCSTISAGSGNFTNSVVEMIKTYIVHKI